jgi:hypothetical protein
MNIQELRTKVESVGMTIMVHQAMSGTMYITVNGYKYRLSDHYQPSHYQCRNYTDVNSLSEIFDIAHAKNLAELA